MADLTRIAFYEREGFSLRSGNDLELPDGVSLSLARMTCDHDDRQR